MMMTQMEHQEMGKVKQSVTIEAHFPVFSVVLLPFCTTYLPTYLQLLYMSILGLLLVISSHFS